MSRTSNNPSRSLQIPPIPGHETLPCPTLLAPTNRSSLISRSLTSPFIPRLPSFSSSAARASALRILSRQASCPTGGRVSPARRSRVSAYASCRLRTRVARDSERVTPAKRSRCAQGVDSNLSVRDPWKRKANQNPLGSPIKIHPCAMCGRRGYADAVSPFCGSQLL